MEGGGEKESRSSLGQVLRYRYSNLLGFPGSTLRPGVRVSEGPRLRGDKGGPATSWGSLHTMHRRSRGGRGWGRGKVYCRRAGDGKPDSHSGQLLYFLLGIRYDF